MSDSNGTELATVVPPQQPASMAPRNLDDAMHLADLMARASLVPVHLQGKPADCFLVIEQAVRWGMSPFAVAQCTSVISGKLMLEGKLVAAVINGRGDLSRRLDYEYTGAGDARTVRVHGRVRGEAADREVIVRLDDARTNNKMWQSQPDQQLMYHGARVWARRHMPELMLGVYSPEEMVSPDVAPPPPLAVVAEQAALEARARTLAEQSGQPRPALAPVPDQPFGRGQAGDRPTPAEPDPTEGRATPPQRKKFYAVAKRVIGADTAEIRAWMMGQLGVEDPDWSSKNLTVAEMSRLIAALEQQEAQR